MYKVFHTSQTEQKYHILDTLHSERNLIQRENTICVAQTEMRLAPDILDVEVQMSDYALLRGDHGIRKQGEI